MTTEQTPEGHQDDEHAALFESEGEPTPTRTTMALDPFDPYDRRSWRGVVANLRTIEMLEITELRGLGSLTPLSIPQGSYTTGVSASGGTHSGGGALDISVKGLSSAERDRVVRELRETSFAAWYRPYLAGVWPAHIHAIAIGDKELSDQAAWQVSEYRAGRNGLANQGPDNGPDVPIHVYRQDIDMSYYGPQRWDAADFTRLFTRWLDYPIGKFDRPDTGEEVSVDVGAALRAARWCFYRLSNVGLEDVAKELFTTDGIFRNVGVDPAVDPKGAYMRLDTLLSNMEDTQDKDHASIEAIKAKLDVT
jgi:hypothetical protein